MKKNKIENKANSFSLHDDFIERSGVSTPRIPDNSNVSSTQPVYGRFTVICDSFLSAKIRTIADNEGFSIREVVEKSFRDTINKYESKHGPIVVKSKKKQHVEDVL